MAYEYNETLTFTITQCNLNREYVVLSNRHCPVCNATDENASLFLEENIDKQKISSFSFASRKEPEFMCHQLMHCNICDLIYVNRPPEQNELTEAYKCAEYDSSNEANDAANSYIEAMQNNLLRLPQKISVLEIGSGTGALLELLKNQGFIDVIGVEPSAAAINAAPVHRRNWLRQGIFSESDFKPASFDLICCFMTLEHVRDPMVIANAAKRLLRPGGAFITVTHDYRGLINRILGKRSPIIDIEHMQLFSHNSIKELFQRNNFECIEIKTFYNRYPLRYWLRLLPINIKIKKFLISVFDALGCADMKIKFNVGNIIAVGYVSNK